MAGRRVGPTTEQSKNNKIKSIVLAKKACFVEDDRISDHTAEKTFGGAMMSAMGFGATSELNILDKF